VISLDELRSALRRCCVKTPVTKSFDLTSVFEHMVKTDMLHENRGEKKQVTQVRKNFLQVAKVANNPLKVPLSGVFALLRRAAVEVIGLDAEPCSGCS
jgi:hypothetical protein